MHAKDRMDARHARRMYIKLAIMVGASLLWMYAAMFAMVVSLDDVRQNLNFVYMAVLMAGAMIPLELVIMRAMYPIARFNVIAIALTVILVAGSFLAIRNQSAIGDDQFLRSMIPHHAGAILMCQQASLTDAEIKALCSGIIESQQREIDQMTSILERRGR